MSTNSSVTLLGVGDVGPIHEPMAAYSELVRATLTSADIRFGQCERVYSERGALQLHSGGAHSRVKPHMASVFTDCGFDVVSVACKNGSIPKEDIGLTDAQKVKPGKFEALCNPVAQAEMLNEHGCEFNVVMGLCIGHDSLFFKYAKGLTTVLVAKDRVLGHNPIAALNLADSYYSKVWGPLKPAKAPKLPVAGRRNT